ncbi:MAG TPA: hypothetical protein VFG42_09155 [Baekduia sp.]|uniref:hypothetical protein n=1 Tax=Baekduia sp. TaxID=2600305 RepID=UPI002D7659CA|nr:hypothetical protein [Baekduia sp.]HET6506944.1 hypothetical protein [Baekduia sp.]
MFAILGIVGSRSPGAFAGLVGAAAGVAAVTYDYLATPRRRMMPIEQTVTHPDPDDVAVAK